MSSTRHHHKTKRQNCQKSRNRFSAETILSNNTSTYGAVNDRYIPAINASSEKKMYNYHDQSLKSPSGSPVRTNIPIVTTIDYNRMQLSISDFDHLSSISSNNLNFDSDDVDDNDISLTDLIDNANSNASNRVSNTDTIDSSSDHQTTVAKALGIDSTKILNFKPFRSPTKMKPFYSHMNDSEHSFSCNNKSGSEDFDSKFNDNFPVSSKKTCVPEIPFKVLDAPGLRNDFYSNLVCWSNKSDIIAAGLGSTVYCWSEKRGTIPLQHIGSQIISALCFSSDDFLAVGTKVSDVFIYKPDTATVIAKYSMKNDSSICSMKWIPNTHFFFIGNDVGQVTLFKLSSREDLKYKGPSKTKITKIVYSIKPKVTFQCDQQQICGIDVDFKGKQLAIGANNNCGSIWDISDLLKPKKMFHLKHEAAVKAVAFCPWMPNLLATGGGSRDKHIRFWHSKSGTLISKFKTKGQITAVIWSRSKKEILVTFGFGDHNEKNDILSVYSYPSMKLKIKVTAPPDMRILTADISNDFSSICTSISDQSVRIYNVWNSKLDMKMGVYEKGIYGSEIIEATEGVDKSIDTIR